MFWETKDITEIQYPQEVHFIENNHFTTVIMKLLPQSGDHVLFMILSTFMLKEKENFSRIITNFLHFSSECILTP